MFHLSFLPHRIWHYFRSVPAAARADGPINKITDLILLSIFVKSREDLLAMARVNKRWNTIANGEPLYNELYSIIDPTGRADWIAQNFGDPGEEPRIPFGWLANFEIGKDLMTLVPESVDKGNGEEIFITALSMGKMWAQRMEIKEPQDRTGYTNDSLGRAIDQNRLAEETHWVWFKGNELIGLSETYKGQEAESRKKGGAVSGLIDTIVTMFLAHAKTGKKYFEWDREASKYTFVRVQEKTHVWRLCVGFAPDGQYVSYSGDDAVVNIGVFVARKSIGY